MDSQGLPMIGRSSILTQQGPELPFNEVSTSLRDHVPDDHDLHRDGSALNNNGAKFDVDRFRSRRKLLAYVLNAITLLDVSALALLLLSFICIRRTNDGVEGVQARRLAEDGGQDGSELTPPSTPELLEQCAELGDQLLSAGFFSGEPNSLLPILEEHEQEEDEGEGYVQGGGPPGLLDISVDQGEGPRMKRPASEALEDYGETPGPSRKAMRMDPELSPTLTDFLSEMEEFWPLFDEDSAEGASQYPELLDSSFSSLLDSLLSSDGFETTAQPSEPSGVSPCSSDAIPPSSAAVAPATTFGPTDDGAIVHPWLQVPALMPGVTPMLFRPERLTMFSSYQTHVDLLNNMRELLRKPALDQSDADRLVVFAELLASHAYQRMNTPVDSKAPVQAAELLARRFMVFYMLHLTSKALKQAWQRTEWWNDLANAVPSYPGDRQPTSQSQSSIEFARQLSAAIEAYKNGGAPGDEQVIDLLRRTFCSIKTSSLSKKAVWDPWRDDDK